MRNRIRLVLTTSIAAGALGIAAASASLPSLSDSTSRTEAPPFAQQAAASDAGITLRALDATFSGTETFVRLLIDPPPQGPFPLSLDTADANVELIGFTQGRVTASALSPAQLLLELPAIDASAIAAAVTLHRITVGAVPVEGTWRLDLTLPHLRERASLLKVDRFPLQTTETFAGVAIDASAVRSSSRLLITYHLPPTVTELRRPQLLVGAERVSPIEISANESGRRVAIFASSVGKPPYAVSFGPFLGSTNATTTLSFSVDGLPDIAALVPGRPARAASVRTLGGDPELLNGVELGVNQDGRAWLALVLVGSWLDHSSQNSGDAEPPTWRIRDKAGRELPMVFSEHYYKKDDAGRVSPNATKIAVVYDSNLDLTNLTVELRTQGVVLDSPWIARFQ